MTTDGSQASSWREHGNGDQPPRPPYPPGPGDADGSPVPPDVLTRHGARLLDPTTAVRFPGQRLRPTAYVADQLLFAFSALTDPDLASRIRAEAAALGYQLSVDRVSLAAASRIAELTGGPASGVDAYVPVLLVPQPGVAVSVDAWPLRQRLRVLAGLGNRVALDHVIPAVRPPHEASAIGEGPTGAPTASGYLFNGRTRQPVSVILPELPRRPDEDCERRPVIAVLDTGCGQHPWLPTGIVDRGVQLDGGPLGLTDPASNPEAGNGDLIGPLDGELDWVAGHGTFIAGVIRQASPNANLLAIRVLHPDGVASEGEVNLALLQLLTLANLDAAGDPAGRQVDVVSLSLGYYHELPEDADQDAPLRALTDGFGRLGIPVVAAAGNESTARPMYPAAFAGTPTTGVPPVISVGALNPDRTVALFSNSGPWVSTWERGALLVSTLPITMNAGAQPASRLTDPSGMPRADVDPDNYSGGYGIWSGTSFAAPLVAGRIAQDLLAAGANLADRSTTAMTARAASAISAISSQGSP